MGAIYASAKLTIVASDGDAMEGIMGLNGISPPRKADQNVTPVFDNEKAIFRAQPGFREGSSMYFKRGWTYQEFYLSKRRLEYVDRHLFNILIGQPDFSALNVLLSEYNNRQLSFPEDALPGISGMLAIWAARLKADFYSVCRKHALTLP
ncbi:hypothetical protein BX600DRAFT_518046 [Xylariales sp. PMI_506]|nr:hypothetical protein BX600DRAFT_518046 [Xylariales sp. PMI_506]